MWILSFETGRLINIIRTGECPEDYILYMAGEGMCAL